MTTSQTRREFFGALAAGTALVSARRENEAAPLRPNVLVIQPDQHRGTIMGCAGDSQVDTPNLDRLAAAGIRFRNCASSSPVCSPFRGSMQTGLYPHLHGVDRNNLLLDPNLTGFAEIFSESGYATGYIGKWHLDGGIPKDQPGGYVEAGPGRQGWQEWNGYQKGHEYFDVWKYDDRKRKTEVPGYEWEPTWHTDTMLDFARRHRDQGQPWLYYLGYGPPHKPEQCPGEFLRRYDPRAFELPEDLRGRFPVDVEQSLRKSLQVYYGQVSGIDFEIGRVLEGLDALGVAENTIIIYTSDHGDHLGSHCPPESGSLRGKATPYATAFRIPLLICWPDKIEAGQQSDALVSSVDLAPTLLDLAGLPVPKQMQGDSMAEWCLTGNGKRNQAVYLGLGGLSNAGWRGLWDGRYVYSPLGFRHLYDHRTDPLEIDNLIDSQQHVEERARLGRLLVQLAAETEDPLMEKVRGAVSSVT